MRLKVKVKPNAKQSCIIGWKEDCLLVHVKEAAEKGAANAAVIRLLCLHFKLPKSSIVLVHGSTSRIKWFELETSSDNPPSYYGIKDFCDPF